MNPDLSLPKPIFHVPLLEDRTTFTQQVPLSKWSNSVETAEYLTVLGGQSIFYDENTYRGSIKDKEGWTHVNSLRHLIAYAKRRGDL